MNETNRQKKILYNYFIYFIVFIIVCFIGISRTLAYSYTVIGDKADITVVLVSTNYGDQPYNVPKNSGYNFNQVLQVDYLVNNYQFNANTHYQLESHLTAQTFTNANAYSVTGLNGEQCLVDYTASIFTGAYPRWDFECPHATTSITLSIYNNAHQYLWDNGIYTWTTAVLSYSNERIPVSSDTQDIINNNNQNTQNIINNQNQNTQQIIESNKVCTYIDKNSIVLDGKYLSSTGIEYNYSDYGITDYYTINKDTDILPLEIISNTANYCIYNEKKQVISCSSNSTLTTNKLSLPDNSSYIRFTISKSANKPQFSICKNGNQALNDSINNLDDTLNNDDTSGATSEASDFFNSFTTETFGLTSIITAPLNLIRSVIGDGSVCTTLHLPLPYLNNKYLDLPCMYGIYSDYFGSFFTIYQTITYGIIAYWVIVRIFNQVKDFKNPEHDEIEVMDL